MSSLKILICTMVSATTIIGHPITTIPDECPSLPLPAPSDTVDVCERPLMYEVQEKDKEILLRIAQAEATGGSVTDKALVMQVVMNRVYNEDFPDTIEEVVFADNPVQFSPTADGRYWTCEPDEDCEIALEQVVCGEYAWCDALFFARKGLKCWASTHKEYLFTEWEHDFYK